MDKAKMLQFAKELGLVHKDAMSINPTSALFQFAEKCRDAGYEEGWQAGMDQANDSAFK